MVDNFEGEKLKIEVDVSVRHASRNIKQAVENASLKFTKEVWTGGINLETISIEMVFTVHESW